MKKKFTIALALIMTLSLFGCTNSGKENNNINTIETDMSGYSNLSETQAEVFKEIEIYTLEDILDNKNTVYIYMGYTGCDKCQKAVVDIAELATTKGETVYYLDCMKIVDNEERYNKALEIMNDVLNTSAENDSKVIQAPEFIKIVNGKYEDFTIGYSETKANKYKAMFGD